MNPFDFVPIDPKNPPELRAPKLHDRFRGSAGEILCRLITETPVFIPEAEAAPPKAFITRNGLPIIPGSSLKGLFRNLVETVGNGCFLLFDGKYERRRVNYFNKLPKEFAKCRFNRRLCIACRMFGMLEKGDVLLGNVSVSDAVTTQANFRMHRPIYTKALMGPKPRHDAFYLDASQRYIAGRKFYFHSPNRIYTDPSKTPYNQHIQPIDRGSTFTFSVHFTNLDDRELATLLYALVLEPAMRHKIGMGKPIGLGSVKIEIQKISLIDYQRRYSSDRAEPKDLIGSECKNYVANRIQRFTEDQHSPTLQALRRIWRWDPSDSTNYAYPDRQWFRTHARYKISQT